MYTNEYVLTKEELREQLQDDRLTEQELEDLLLYLHRLGDIICQQLIKELIEYEEP